MKKILVLSLSILLFAFYSCDSSKDNLSPCEVNKTGTVTISNSSSNPYDIYIDNVFKIRLAGGSISQKITVDEGNGRVFYAEQVSGYLLFPTTKTLNTNVVRCTDYSWQIP